MVTVLAREALTPEETVRRGLALYGKSIRHQVEPQHNGKVIVLNIDTAEYEIDRDDWQGEERMLARNPDARLLLLTVGDTVAYRMGGVGASQ